MNIVRTLKKAYPRNADDAFRILCTAAAGFFIVFTLLILPSCIEEYAEGIEKALSSPSRRR